jgi:hypothetical protein
MPRLSEFYLDFPSGDDREFKVLSDGVGTKAHAKPAQIAAN